MNNACDLLEDLDRICKKYNNELYSYNIDINELDEITEMNIKVKPSKREKLGVFTFMFRYNNITYEFNFNNKKWYMIDGSKPRKTLHSKKDKGIINTLNDILSKSMWVVGVEKL